MTLLQAKAKELGLPLHRSVVTESAIPLPPWKPPSFRADLILANPSRNLQVTLDALLATHADKPIYYTHGSKTASSVGCVMSSVVVSPTTSLVHLLCGSFCYLFSSSTRSRTEQHIGCNMLTCLNTSWSPT